MDESNTAAFVDRKESHLSVPPPTQMSAAGASMTCAEENESGMEVCAQALDDPSPFTLVQTIASSAQSEEEKQASSSPVNSTESPFLTATAGSSSVSPTLPLSSAQCPAPEDATQHIPFDVSTTSTGTELMSPVEESAGQERAVADISNGTAFLPEAADAGRPEEEKGVSEYCPGLAIRSLALENILDRSGPSSSSAVSEDTTSSVPSSELGTSQLMSQSIASSTLFSAGSRRSTSSDQNLIQFNGHAAATPRKPLFDPIEVERKFTVEADTEDKLRSLGAKLHKEKTFTDVYYDNDEYSLILSDCWLRRRNDAWEAKLPHKPQQQSAHALFSPATQYREITEEREISTWLVDHLGLEPWMRGDPLELLVQAAGLTAFARFTTVRRTYNLPTCVVDLDLIDHGFRVGEIEVMAGSPEEVPQALQTISSVARQLGLTPLTLA